MTDPTPPHDRSNRPENRAHLESITPSKAIDLYLEHRSHECAESTITAHRRRLKQFRRWCENEGIDDLSTLTGRDCYRFRVWRQNDGNLNKVSLRTQLSTLRVFLRFCVDIDAVAPAVPEKVAVPSVDASEKSRDAHITEGRASVILDRLKVADRATKKHLAFRLLWYTGMRTGTLRALDVKDVVFREDKHSYLDINHRPETGTPLKNKSRAERKIAITDETELLINEWLEYRHPEVQDEHGRLPLFATENGRWSRHAIRRAIYWVTRPEYVGEDCSCDVEEHGYDNIAACDDVMSPHDIRRSAITNMLRQDMPKPMTSDRADVSPEVLDRHYNELTERERMEQRSDYLRDL